MNKFNLANLSKIANDVRKAASKHSPEILTGIGIAGMATSIVLAVRATPKAILLLEDRKEELEVEKLPGGEIVKTAWKCYIPTAVLATTSAACLIGSSSINAKRNAALATAYQLSREALIEYKDKVVEVVGDKKAKTIQEKVDKERIEKNPVTPSTEVFITGKGEILCYDSISGRYFKSSKDNIERSINKLNKRIIDEMYISLNDFYDALGLPCTKIGNELGWNIDDGLIEIDYSAQMGSGMYEGEPCVCVDYYVAPRYGFDKLM